MQTKPIRSATGSDITENTLRSTLQSLGIKREIRELSYVEKRLVMVISLTKQLSNAQGDLARTIESPANQLKILQQQLDRLKIAIGEFLEIGMRYILPLLNGIMMALVVIVETFTQFIKDLVGYQELEIDYGNLKDTSEELDDLIDGMKEANEQAEELEKHLIGIDELNILAPEESITDGIDPAILNEFYAAMEEWDNKMNEVQMKAYAIRDTILSWFGLEPTDNGAWGLKEGESLARSIYDFISNTDLSNLINGFSQIVGLIAAGYLALLAWKIILNPFIWIIAGIYTIWKALNTEFSDGYTWLDSYEKTLLGISLLVAGIALLFKSWTVGQIAIIIFGIYEIIKGINGIVKDGIADWEDMQKILLGISIILATFGIITKNWALLAIAGITLLGVIALNQLVGFGDRLKNGTTTFFDWVALIFMALLTSIVKLVEGALKGILTVLLVIVGAVGDAIFIIFASAAATVETLLAPILLALKGILAVYDAIMGTNISSKIKLYTVTTGTIKTMLSWDKYIYDKIGETWSDGLGKRMDESVINAINSAPEPTSDKTISKEQLDQQTSQFEQQAENLTTSNKQMVDYLSSSLDEQEKHTQLLELSNTFLGDISDFYNNLSEEDRKRILNNTYSLPSGYANGGYPSKGLFLMNEGASAEMVGSIGGKTAVVNNEQIASALAQALAPMLGSVVMAVENVAANDRPIILNVDSRQMARANQKGSQKLGYNQIGGEFANV